MFIIDTKNKKSNTIAFSLIKEYELKFDIVHGLIIIKSENNDNFRLSEVAFQMNLSQKGNVCKICETNGETVCGHLTFT